MTCTVTGSVIDLQAQPKAGQTLTFGPQVRSLARFDSSTAIPDAVSVTADASGNFSVDLLPGVYTVKAEGGLRGSVQITVPDSASALLEQIIDAPAPVSIDAAQQAVLDARDEREQTQQIAGTVAGQASTVNTQHENVVLKAGQVDTQHANVVQKAGVVDTQHANVVQKAGEVDTQHGAVLSAASTVASNLLASQNIKTAIDQVFDDLDDRFLGVFDADPTTDNDGDPLERGAVYVWVDDLVTPTESETRFWDGVQWEGPEGAASQAAAQAFAAQEASELAQAGAETAETNASGHEDAAGVYASTANTKANEAAGSAATSKVWADSALAVSGNSAAAYVASLPYSTPPVAVEVAPCGVPEWVRLGMGMSWANEEVHTGPQIGMFANEAAARAYCTSEGITAEGAIYETPEGRFFKLSAGSGQTEVNRGDQVTMPRTLIIVAHPSYVVIRNGDKPGAPMWMVFITAVTYVSKLITHGTDGGVTSISFVNGVLVVSTSSGTTNQGANGVFRIDFAADGAIKYGASQISTPFDGRISDRNTGGVNNYLSGIALTGLGSNFHNDIAVFVLPDAPVVNGVQVPTVAVACGSSGDGWLSIIKDTGEVVSYAGSAGAGGYEFYHVDFDDAGNLYAFHSYTSGGSISDLNFFAADALRDLSGNATPSGSHGQISWGYNTRATTLNITSGDRGSTSGWVVNSFQAGPEKSFLIGNTRGVFLTHAEGYDHTKGMVRHVAETHDTGFMPAGTVFAGLCEAGDDSDLVENTFEDDFTSYADEAAAISAGYVKDGTEVSFDAANDHWTWSGVDANLNTIDIDVPSEAGKTLRITVTTENVTGGSGRIFLDGALLLTGIVNETDFVDVVATESTTTIRFHPTSGFDGALTYLKSETLQLDRSGNGNHAIITGTLTSSYVNTGAEMTALSGFSADDYLSMDNLLPDMSGDFVFQFSMSKSTTSNNRIFEIGDHDGSDYAGHAFRMQFASMALRFYKNGGSGVPSIAMGTATPNLPEGVWKFITAGRYNGLMQIWVDDQLGLTTPDATDFSNPSAKLKIGGSWDAGSLTAGSLSGFTIGTEFPSQEQIRRQAQVSKFLHAPDSKAKILDNVIRHVSRDPIRKEYLILTDGGLVVMSYWGNILRTDATIDSNAIAQRDGLKVVA